MSICGNCYFILTLLGVCHETVNFFPFKFDSQTSPANSVIQEGQRGGFGGGG